MRGAAALTFFLIACFLAALVGMLFVSTSVSTWYPLLRKPIWTPPAWVFGPVWTVLYAMMAFAAWLVWRRLPERAARPALVLFGVQLVLNVVWSAVFFGLRRPNAAFVEIVVLWLALAATVYAFWRVSVRAALLMTPYLGWVTFAAGLNFAIWRLNG